MLETIKLMFCACNHGTAELTTFFSYLFLLLSFTEYNKRFSFYNNVKNNNKIIENNYVHQFILFFYILIVLFALAGEA